MSMRKRKRNNAKADVKSVSTGNNTKESNTQANTSLSSLNDLSWYAHYPDLLVAGASFPYPYRPGMVTDPIFHVQFSENTIEPSEYSNRVAVPGVFAIDWVPSLGQSNSVLDPASLVAKELFARVRSSFSGTLAADAPDFIIYLMALDSVFSYLSWCKRVFRVVGTYSPDNRMVPEGLLKAMGFGDTAITMMMMHKMQMFSNINELIKMSRKFVCPAVMDIFNRHYWMNDNVYTDAPSANSQFFVFNQAYWYKFKMLDTPDKVKAGGLTLVKPDFYDSPSVVDAMYAFGKDLISALAESEDSYIISGYLMRAFEGTPAFAVADLEYAEVLNPVYVEEVLTQIENSNAIPVNAGSGGNFVVHADITQDPTTNTVLSNPVVSNSYARARDVCGFDKHILSIRADAPSAADNVIASRLRSTFVVKEADTGSDFEVDCASEFVLTYRVMRYDDPKLDPENLGWVSADIGGYILCSTGANAGTAMDLGWAFLIPIISQFDWHPLIPLLACDFRTSATAPKVWANVLGDIHNFTVITAEQLGQLNRICLLSEFNAFNI